jgi:hypothetical protein
MPFVCMLYGGSRMRYTGVHAGVLEKEPGTPMVMTPRRPRPSAPPQIDICLPIRSTWGPVVSLAQKERKRISE